MTGTLISIFNFRLFDILGLLLLFIWAFSPVGSQASIRSVGLRPATRNESRTLSYYNHSLIPLLSDLQGADGANWYALAFESYYGAALFDPTAAMQYSNATANEWTDTTTGIGSLVSQMGGEAIVANNSMTDLWGNVRIPIPEHVEGFNEESPETWLNLAQGQVAPYGSLIGVPITGLPTSGVGGSEFTVETNHHLFTVRILLRAGFGID